MAVLACVAVIVVEPAPTMVTLGPLIVATAVFELVYVKAPLLVEVGALRANAELPTALDATEKLLSVGVILFTTNSAVIVPDE